MRRYEYKIVPAPTRGQKGPGIKGAEARFSHGVEIAINTLAEDGWEYLRADILPSEERQGLTSSQTVYRSVLVFRRAVAQTQDQEPDEQSQVEPSSAQSDEDEHPAEETEDTPSDETDEVENTDAEDPPSDIRERAVSSLYATSDNSKQD